MFFFDSQSGFKMPVEFAFPRITRVYICEFEKTITNFTIGLDSSGVDKDIKLIYRTLIYDWWETTNN